MRLFCMARRLLKHALYNVMLESYVDDKFATLTINPIAFAVLAVMSMRNEVQKRLLKHIKKKGRYTGNGNIR